MERIPMTRQGYEQARKRLEHLKNVEMPRVEKALGDAREMGDLSENAEFDTARSELWTLEQQIAELEDKVARADVIDSTVLTQDTVAIGATLEVEDLDARRREEIVLVGEGEVRPGVDTVSVTSPLGQGFIGRKVGDVVEVQVPRGLLRYRILSFRYA